MNYNVRGPTVVWVPASRSVKEQVEDASKSTLGPLHTCRERLNAPGPHFVNQPGLRHAALIFVVYLCALAAIIYGASLIVGTHH